MRFKTCPEWHNFSPIIYFDYNATTPTRPEIARAMANCMQQAWGNPSSVHAIGRRSRAILDEAHERMAAVLGCGPGEVVFTGGGTESVNLALMGAARRLKSKGRHILCSSIEHHAVLHSLEYLAKNEGFEVFKLPVNVTGEVSPGSVAELIRPDTILVSVQAANNEIGTLQSVSEIGSLCKSQDVLFHTDAVQWFGKLPFDSVHDFNADLVSICAHKLFGPKGSGALFIRSPLHIDPILFGGSHENERRAGTENLPAIIGLVECMEKFSRTPIFEKTHLLHLTGRIVEALAPIPGVHLVSPQLNRLPNTVSFVVAGADSIALLAGLDIEGICASSGSACSAGSLEPSHVIRALGYNDELANSLVRFSLGPESTTQEVEYLIDVFPKIVGRVQQSQQTSRKL